MQVKHFIQPLAASLSQQIWTRAEVEAHLARHLPAAKRKMAPELAKDLIEYFPAGVAPDTKTLIHELQYWSEIRALHNHARKHGIAPQHDLSPPRFIPHPRMDQLPPLATSKELADWLAISPEQLVRFADLRGLSARSADPFGVHYHQHLIPKRNGQLRLIEEPKPFLKRLQRKLLRGLLDLAPPHDAAYGFRAGRNCIAAAARHSAEAVVISFDLAHFFPSIGYSRIYSLFRTLGYPAAVARDLSGLCTTLCPKDLLHRRDIAGIDLLSNRHLPQGAPTSPALANLAAYRLDCRLAGLARSLEARYTRYADDLTFSGDRRIAPVLHRALPMILSDAGFAANPAKTRQSLAHHQQRVTGIVVNSRPNLPRADYDLLKATLHRLSNPSDPRRQDAAFLARLSGRIAWAEQVNPTKAAKLRASFDLLRVSPR